MQIDFIRGLRDIKGRNISVLDTVFRQICQCFREILTDLIIIKLHGFFHGIIHLVPHDCREIQCTYQKQENEQRRQKAETERKHPFN